MTVVEPDEQRPDKLRSASTERAETRQLVAWCPDWPVVAAATELGLSTQLPLAVFERGEVFACSAMARVEGVRRGMRRRDASARCPELTVLERNEASEIRTFESVLSAIEEISAGVAPVRPGLCALRVPSRFYGGEREAAAVVAEHLVGAGVWDFRIGIADGIFAAEHAARRAAPQDCWIIPPNGSATFLAGLSIGVLENAELVTLLRRFGIPGRNRIGFDCASFAQRLRLALGGVGDRLLLGFGVDLGAEQDRVHGEPEPEEQHDDSGEDAVCFRVVAKGGRVDREPDRGNQPDDGCHGSAN